MGEKLLLHACCAPCSVACVSSLRSDGINPELYWFNPNIHPKKEYAERRDTLKKYCLDENLPLHLEDGYGLQSFLSCNPAPYNKTDRCRMCYETRLSATAEFASQRGFSSFSTTLLISPYQNHELIKTLAQEAAGRYKVDFLYRDFRPIFREGQQDARKRGMYMQKYCGCIFSEEERYIKL